MRVSILTDNKIAASYLRRILVHAGNEVFVATTLDQFMNATHADPDIVLMELNLPGTPTDLARQKIEEIKKVPILPIAAYSIQHDARVDDFHAALLALRESNNAEQYISLIEALLGEKIT